jgi:hypothetical protein
MISKSEKCKDCQYYSMFFKYCYKYSDDVEQNNTEWRKNVY